MKLAVVAATLAAVAAVAAPAHADPSNAELVGVGAALALPDYMLGVSLHESSHALAAKMVGADVDELHVFPPGTDPKAHTFRFGWTYVHGLPSRRAKAFFLLAPKLVDSLLLGGFTALAFSNSWPSNRYGEVALTVAGTGLWIDFSKDLVLFSHTTDVGQVQDMWCMRGWREVPMRLVYLGIVAAWGYAVEHAYRRTFDSTGTSAAATPPAFVVPLIHVSL
nr:hypothetical protein [Kofleriaceae bacterium]